MRLKNVLLSLADNSGVAGIQTEGRHKSLRVFPAFFNGLYGSIVHDVARSRNKRAINCRTTGDQRTPSPPKMQRRYVPLSHGLLPRRLFADRLNWQIVFD